MIEALSGGASSGNMTRVTLHRSLSDRVASTLPQLAEPALQHLLKEVTWYRHLSAERVENEIRDIVQENLRLFVTLLREGRAPTPDDVRTLLQSASRRAEDRIPLPSVLAAYYAGAKECWVYVASLAEPGESKQVVALGSRLLEYLQFVCTAITEAYVETNQAIRGQERAARSALLDAVIAGHESAELWDQAGMTAWGKRTVVLLRMPPALHDDQVTAALEGRRAARLVRESLSEVAEGELLDALGHTGGIAVLAGVQTADVLQDALTPVLAGPWVAGRAEASGGDTTADACRSAGETAEVAHRLGLPPGVYDLANLRLEVQLTRPGPARDQLVALLEPLADHPDLMTTLSAYVESEGRRAEVAGKIHVHPNTLDYRLQRVTSLVGMDPTEREGALTLRAAMVATRFVAGRPG